MLYRKSVCIFLSSVTWRTAMWKKSLAFYAASCTNRYFCAASQGLDMVACSALWGTLWPNGVWLKQVCLYPDVWVGTSQFSYFSMPFYSSVSSLFTMKIPKKKYTSNIWMIHLFITEKTSVEYIIRDTCYWSWHQHVVSFFFFTQLRNCDLCDFNKKWIQLFEGYLAYTLWY